MDNEQVIFRGVPTRCNYDTEDYKVYIFNVDSDEYPDIEKHPIYKTVSVVGNMQSLTIDVEYEITAVKQTNKYGTSYKVIKIHRDTPKTIYEVFNFLKEILTDNQANTIVEVYPNIVELVKEGKTNEIDFSKLKGIGEKSFEKIKEKIIQNYVLIDLINDFGGYLSMNIIRKLYNKYTSIEKLKEKIRQEPYLSLTQISNIGFKKADLILLDLEKASKEKVGNGGLPIVEFETDLISSKERCLACMLYLLQENENNNGNTRMNLADLRTECLKIIPEAIDNYVDALKDGRIYYNKETMNVALKETYNCEKAIAFSLLERLKIDNKWDYDIQKYKTIDGVELSEEQVGLLDSVCKNQVTVLAAPAGSGKSFSTKALVNMLRDNKKSYTCVSPTGKAAKRLSQYINGKANTIHRTLGYQDGHFLLCKEMPLQTDVLIVDEVGMTDIKLFSKLLDAILNTTKIVLIGDNYQLNSIGSGALLRDILSCDKIPKLTLSKIFRMGIGGVLTACTYVRENHKFINDNVVTKIGEDGSYVFIPCNKENVNRSIVQLYKKLLETNDSKDITVISAFNVGDNGCTVLNKMLQPIANPKSLREDTKSIKITQNKDEIIYYVGDTIIENVNNYKAVLYKENEDESITFVPNGTQGTIVDIDKSRVIIEFEGVKVLYTKAEMSMVKHAFALSVYKMQGSQNKIIIFSAPSSHTYFLNNNLIYTAISRAEDKVYHFTDNKTLNICMNKSENVSRQTTLGILLNEMAV